MRNSRKRTHTTWTKETSRLAHEAKARKRLANNDTEPRRIPAGTYLGTLRWHSAEGTVTQCVIKQGTRANRIRIGKTECGWDCLMRRMRGRLSVKKETTTQ